MSGGHFDYAQYRIDDIIASIEREIEAATCERTELIKEEKIAVKTRDCYGYQHYKWHWQNFRSIESAKKYFNDIGFHVLEQETSEQEVHRIKMRDPVTGDEIEIYSYTDEHYAPNEEGEEPYYRDWSEETVAEFRRAVTVLKRASIYTQRIDWLLSGDDGEETFHKRLKKELLKLRIEEEDNGNRNH